MAVGLSSVNSNSQIVTWLASAVRTTSQNISLTVPEGAVGIEVEVNVTSVPGVDLIALNSWYFGTFVIRAGGTSASTGSHYQLLRNVKGYSANPVGGGVIDCAGICSMKSLYLEIVHSGSGNFTYSAIYRWLKK
jgi:hypothetical protein